MAKQKKQAPPGPKPGELPVTFTDMVTLLLTFFVFLMTMANFDEQKLQDFFQAAGGNFGIGGSSGAGVLLGGNAITSEQANLSAGPDVESTNASENFRSGADTPGTGDVPTVTQSDKQKSDQVQVNQQDIQQFKAVSEQLQTEDGLQSEMTTQGLKITLEQSFSQFGSGSAALPPSAVPALREMISTNLKPLIDQGFEIVVTGHTDDIPLGSGSSARFTDNRGLATERANNVLRVFESMGVPPAQISAAGYGPHKPIADNSTQSGREQNRRIEILVKYKEFSEPDYQTPPAAPAP
ncbi:MAG: flagellar motor protein MotB [Candidatus Poribacteria bacterium]|nr:flagellar motor protein MotB [Candidatus Poribacteria bacterium]